MFDAAGRVVGINAQIYSRTGGYEGLSFAIPIDVALRIRDQIVETGEARHAQLGVTVQELDQALADSFDLKSPAGALVSQISPDSAAARAGLRPGDVILAFNGQPIERSGDLAARVGMSRPGASGLRVKAREWLDFFGLTQAADQMPRSLAFGQQRYVELARAMMLEPKLLLLDEPASGLNDAEVSVFASVLRKIRDEGVTIVLIEHDMKLIMSICDEILVLAQGRKLAEGTPEEVRSNPEVIEAYLGTPDEVSGATDA